MEHLIYTALPEQDPTRAAVPYSRILDLYPGEGSDPFFCTLQVVDISRVPFPFEALSYVWGREKSDNVLLCNDNNGNILGQLTLTKNLENALRGLRLPHEIRRLWIDAVCIRQDDNAERARQVSYMRAVYQNATRVVVWLGLKDSTVRRAFTFAQDMTLLAAAINQDQSASQAPQSPRQMHEQNLRAKDIILNAMRNHPEDSAALDALFNKEYFERVWCIQEVAAGNQIIAKCEDLEIDFNMLLINVPHIMQHRGLAPITSGLQMWLAMTILKSENMTSRDPRDNRPTGSLGTILTVLMMVRNFKATNPVDRIFALLGCTDEGLEPLLGSLNTFEGAKKSTSLRVLQRGAIWLAKKMNDLGPEMQFGRPPALKPNYDKSVKDVYRDFARYCVRRSPRVLDVLSHVQHHGDVTGNDEFPSWVPKFHEPRIVSSFTLDVYMAGIPPTGHYRYFAELHDNPLLERNIVEPDVLQAEGFRVDVVEAVSEAAVQDPQGKISPQKLWEELSPGIPLFQPHRPTSQAMTNGEHVDVAFFMTMVAGGVINKVHLGLGEGTVDRDEGLEDCTRQAKCDIHEWLKEEPGANPSAYEDLVRDSVGATRAQGRTRYEACVVAMCINRKVYRTRSGILGLGPKVMRPGDVVVVLFGGKYPYVLRQVGAEWLFLGETYVRNEEVMRGRAVMEVRRGSRQSEIEMFRIR